MAKIPDLRSTEDVPSGPIAWLKAWLDDLRLWVQTRDPQATAVGDTLDKFTTRGELVRVGLLTRDSTGGYSAGGIGGGGVGPAGPVGPMGPPGDSYVPDLTPPPTPSGLTVIGAISNIIITWTPPTYTQGRGNDRTNVYGAIWLPADAAPTFGDVRTKLITTAAGGNSIVAYASNPDTRWCIWIKFQSIDGVESTSPAGGSNGAQATTGQDVRALLDVLTQAAYNPASPYSRVSFRADQFYILPDVDFAQESTPTGTTVGELWMQPSTNIIQRWSGSAWAPFDNSVPFLVQTNPTTINGVNIPAGVYMRSAFIYDLTASIARLGTAWIDTAMVASLNAGKITAGSVGVGEYLQSTAFSSGVSGWRIHGNGSAEFASASIRGQLTAAQIDSRNLTIQDGAGNILFGSGTNLAAAYINPAGNWINGNIGINANGTLSGAGGGAVTIPGLDSTVLRAGFPITAGNVSTYIAGAAIGYANIGSVDAGTITVGLMNAARLVAGSIQTDKIQVGAVGVIAQAATGTTTPPSLTNISANATSVSISTEWFPFTSSGGFCEVDFYNNLWLHSPTNRSTADLYVVRYSVFAELEVTDAPSVTSENVDGVVSATRYLVDVFGFTGAHATIPIKLKAQWSGYTGIGLIRMNMIVRFESATTSAVNAGASGGKYWNDCGMFFSENKV